MPNSPELYNINIAKLVLNNREKAIECAQNENHNNLIRARIFDLLAATSNTPEDIISFNYLAARFYSLTSDVSLLIKKNVPRNEVARSFELCISELFKRLDKDSIIHMLPTPNSHPTTNLFLYGFIFKKIAEKESCSESAIYFYNRASELFSVGGYSDYAQACIKNLIRISPIYIQRKIIDFNPTMESPLYLQELRKASIASIPVRVRNNSLRFYQPASTRREVATSRSPSELNSMMPIFR